MLQLTPDADCYELNHADAVLPDTLEKIRVLHDMGALPTEIVGLADTGDFLIVKQPEAYPRPYTSGVKSRADRDALEKDRAAAVEAIKGIDCICTGLRQTVAISVLEGHPWIVADLHHRNLMHDANGNPAIIDALIGEIPSAAFMVLAPLAEAMARARAWRDTGVRPRKRRFDDVADDDL